MYFIQGGGKSSCGGAQVWHPEEESPEMPELAADYVDHQIVSEIKVGVLNFASLVKHVKLVEQCECDVLVVPEARGTSDLEPDLRHKLEVMGFSCVCLHARVNVDTFALKEFVS